MDRRTVLSGTGIAFSVAFAGCTAFEGEQSDEDTEADQDDAGDLDENDSTNEQDDEQSDEGEGSEIQEDEAQDRDKTTEEQDSDDEPEEQPAVVLPEEAEEHIEVQSHELTGADSDETECEFHVELERTSGDEFHISFESEIELCTENGDTIAESAGPSVSNDLEEGKSRVYSTGFDDCEGADEYTFEVVNFSAPLLADAMEADIDVHPDLEDKVEVTGHEFSWVDEPGDGTCRIRIVVKNTTSESVISTSVNSDNIERGLTTIEPGETVQKEIEGPCTEDIEQYQIQIGTSDYEINEVELVDEYHEEIDADGEVLLPENAEDHLAVRDHALVWRGPDQTECEIRVEFEKTSADKYLLSFHSEMYVYSDDGDEITGGHGLGASKDEIEKGEHRIYSSSIPGGCDGVGDAAEYTVDVRQFGSPVRVDDLETNFDLDSELEDKLEITEHSLTWEGSELSANNYRYCYTSATVKNVTENYRLTITGPDSDVSHKTVTLEPDETASFYHSGYCATDTTTYGFPIEADEVTEI